MCFTDATVTITNHTDAQTVTIYKGIGKIRSNDTKILHVINLEQIRDALTNLQFYVDKDLKYNSLYHTIQHEISQTFVIFKTITTFHSRKSRAINILGTAWKFVAGSPDHDDLVLITDSLDKLTTNNNKQVIINRQLEDRLNKLTKISNDIANTIKRDSLLSNELAISFQNQVRLIKEEVVNIKYAIQWAKLNMINTFLLSENEINIINNQFKNGHMPPLTTEEMLEFSDVSILHNGTTLIYLIKIPNLETTTFQNYVIKPIIKSNNIVNLPASEIFENKNKKEMFGVKGQCKNLYNIKICNKNKLEDLSQNSCLPKLLGGEQAMCEFTNADHVPILEEIDEGIILVNDFNGTITWPGNAKQIKGTYLINFWNETIIINGEEFSNTEIQVAEPSIPLIQIAPVEIERLRILSLKALEGLHIDNTEKLQKLQTHSSVNRISFIASIVSLAILTLTLHWCKGRKKTINLQLGNIEPEIPKVTPTPPAATYQPPSTQFNNIPFF